MSLRPASSLSCGHSTPGVQARQRPSSDDELAHERRGRVHQAEQAEPGDTFFSPGAEACRPAVEEVGAVELRQRGVDAEGPARIERAAPRGGSSPVGSFASIAMRSRTTST